MQLRSSNPRHIPIGERFTEFAVGDLVVVRSTGEQGRVTGTFIDAEGQHVVLGHGVDLTVAPAIDVRFAVDFIGIR